MRIISRRPIDDFKAKHTDSLEALEHWYATLKKGRFTNFVALKETFGNSVDVVDKGFVFDICNNKYRLAASIHFNAQTVYIREIMTHAEYSKNKWKLRHQDFH
ncbi:MAG TPA: type II toxin-antitoxin system HigB family toxin [Coleofasciculaceae cyanobacterium]|jgi:mRNA interferase HigB